MTALERIPLEARTRRMKFSSKDETCVATDKDFYCNWQNRWPHHAERRFGLRPQTATKLSERYYVQIPEGASVYCSLPSKIFDWVKYDVDCQKAVLAVFSTSTLEKEFNQLASRWYQETGMSSMIHVKAMHPSYQRIIGMGKDALPFIFRELSQRRGHWLWALCAITGEDAARPTDNIKQAVESWLRWGLENGYI